MSPDDAPPPDPTFRPDAAQIETLLVDYLPRLRAYLRLRRDPLLAAQESTMDLVQSVCREILERRDRFEYRSEAEFRSWLFRAALMKLADRRKFHQREKRDARRMRRLEELRDEQELRRCYSTITSPSEVLLGREAAERLERAFEELPEHYRDVITMSRLLGLGTSAIAEELGKSEAAVRQMLGRALVELASRMDSD
ncbi:MAG: sigma-70 family RNA polymerase sigma factor [Planctomycetes bacterium]|nr:sigma-70 family RNA polymerase sigma factor [Planctomycetota bacterium]